MAKGKRFKTKKKSRLKNFLYFYLVIVVVMFANYTFSRYTATANSATSTNVAKFSVKVNEVNLNKEQYFNLKLSPTTNTYNGKIAPDTTGNFEIEIDPTDTEVSLEYTLKINVANFNNKLVLENYSVDNGTTFVTIPEDSIIKGEINLPENAKSGFKSEDKVIIKVYWKWEEDITNPTLNDLQNKTISITSTIKQKIN